MSDLHIQPPGTCVTKNETESVDWLDWAVFYVPTNTV